MSVNGWSTYTERGGYQCAITDRQLEGGAQVRLNLREQVRLTLYPEQLAVCLIAVSINVASCNLAVAARDR